MKPRPNAFATYWYFATERQNIFFSRLSHASPPYSSDPIFTQYKFCNAYRASDRVSQYLIKHVIYEQPSDEQSMLLRIVLFRLFNSISTWESLEHQLGEPIDRSNFSIERYTSFFATIRSSGFPLYGNAFILAPTTHYGSMPKHESHLHLLSDILRIYSPSILQSPSLQALYTTLLQLPMIGPFMAYQIAIDLNYSELFSFDENSFTVAGPGAIRGIQKCFEDLGDASPSECIMWMVEHQEEMFLSYELPFKSLFGRRLHAIDCQGLFCETDKYTRVSLPSLQSNRKRIKTHFRPSPSPLTLMYPPKWRCEINSV